MGAEWIQKDAYYMEHESGGFTIAKTVHDGRKVYTLWKIQPGKLEGSEDLGSFDTARKAMDAHRALEGK